MMRLPWSICLLLASSLVYLHYTHASDTYFIFKPTDTLKCIVFEQAEATAINFKYDIMNWKEEMQEQVQFEVRPKNIHMAEAEAETLLKQVLDGGMTKHPVAKQKGSFGIHFNKHYEGLHVCLVRVGQVGASPADQAAATQKVHLDYVLGYTEEYYEELALKGHLNKFQMMVLKLEDRLGQMLNEADFMKEKELVFHAASENMNDASMWWPLIQLSILILTGIFQVNYLKNFFKSKKLV